MCLFLTSEGPGTGVALPPALGGEQAQAVAVSAALVLYGGEEGVGAVGLLLPLRTVRGVRAL